MAIRYINYLIVIKKRQCYTNCLVDASLSVMKFFFMLRYDITSIIGKLFVLQISMIINI